MSRLHDFISDLLSPTLFIYVLLYIDASYVMIYFILRPLVMSAYQKKKISYFSAKTYIVGTQKNHLNETVLLSTQNIC